MAVIGVPHAFLVTKPPASPRLSALRPLHRRRFHNGSRSSLPVFRRNNSVLLLTASDPSLRISVMAGTDSRIFVRAFDSTGAGSSEIELSRDALSASCKWDQFDMRCGLRGALLYAGAGRHRCSGGICLSRIKLIHLMSSSKE